MNLTWQIQGPADVRASLAKLPDEIAHTCITSPPYWGMRDYGVDGQIGLEPTPEEHIAVLVGVFREVRRVLRDDGTLWVNYGDAYNAGGRGGNPDPATSTLQGSTATQEQSKIKRYMRRPSATADHGGWAEEHNGAARVVAPSLKPKDLMGLPWMLAFALRSDGWYLRQDIIWHKRNPMPESVNDRCTKAHEYLFLLSKSARYYFDGEAIKEPASGDSHSRSRSNRAKEQHKSAPTEMRNGLRPPGVNPKSAAIKRGHGGVKAHAQWSAAHVGMVDMANKRSVWSISSEPTAGDHFAAFPQSLVLPCVKAGSPVGGVVLDPFSGTGTTGVVALKQSRSYIGCELNPKDVRSSRKRLGLVAPLLASEVAA